jgi:ATP-dependent Clp protease ATP-binding subunit ClpB
MCLFVMLCLNVVLLKVVSRWTGIPVAALDPEETEKLIHLADRLHERVVGQNEAVNLVVQAVLRSRAGLDPPGQPIGSFLFLGSTGVGKTELANALAEQQLMRRCCFDLICLNTSILDP